MKMTADIAQYVEIAHELAEISQPIIQRYFRTPLAVDNKDDGTPVTMADCAAELAMRDHLTKFYPAHGIYGEEYGSSKLDHNPLWVLDPIDGTAAFSTGLPVFGTLIAALWDHRPLVGLINQPIMGERWVGCQGEASKLNRTKISTRKTANLAAAILYTTTPDMFTTPADKQAFDRVQQAVRFRRFGGDCYAYGLLASGFIDLVVESGLKPYDFLALVPIIEGAGGIITDWQGQPLSVKSGPNVVATATKSLHDQALSLLNP